MDPTVVAAEHAARLAALDPLLPPAGPLAPEPGTTFFTAEVGESVGVGSAWFTELGPNTAARTWDAVRQHCLAVRLAGPDQVSALGALLEQWTEHLRDVVEPGDQDAAAIVQRPSRDTGSTLALLRHGFAPVSVVAVRQKGRQLPPGGNPAVTVRRLTEADLDVAVALNLEVVTYDASFGKVTPRPDTVEGLRNYLRYLLGTADPQAWLAELDGRPVGLLHLELGPAAAWAARFADHPNLAYLSCLGVTESVRGGGVGRALVDHAHRLVDEADVGLTLLHHALPNPRSAPFWYSNGYRPLWTLWYRRPALR